MSKVVTVKTIVLALLLATISSPAYADLYDGTTGTVDCLGGGTFTITDNVLTGNDDCAGDAVIPAEVTSIGNYAFYDANALENLSFAEGSNLETIGDYAFESTAALTSITIPASVRSIPTGAFFRAPALETVIFARGSLLESIGNSAFAYTAALTSITIPASVRSIGDFC